MNDKKKSISQVFIVVIIVMLTFSVISCNELENLTESQSTHEVTIAESDDGTWRLYDEEDEEIDMGTITVNREDTIIWNAPNSNVVFGFTLDMENYFELNEDQFTETDDSLEWPENDNTDSNVRRIQEVAAGETLSLSVSEDSPYETIDYDIYIVEVDTFVVGNSPPYIEIQRSQ